MAATFIKRGNGGGDDIIWVGTDNITNPCNERYKICEVEVNRSLLNGLSANCQAQLTSMTINNILSITLGSVGIQGSTQIS